MCFNLIYFDGVATSLLTKIRQNQELGNGCRACHQGFLCERGNVPLTGKTNRVTTKGSAHSAPGKKMKEDSGKIVECLRLMQKSKHTR